MIWLKILIESTWYRVQKGDELRELKSVVRKKTVTYSKTSGRNDQFSRNLQVVEPWTPRDGGKDL
jgi:hypothetical protein